VVFVEGLSLKRAISIYRGVVFVEGGICRRKVSVEGLSLYRVVFIEGWSL
jgi:hypothetical protein